MYDNREQRYCLAILLLFTLVNNYVNLVESLDLTGLSRENLPEEDGATCSKEFGKEIFTNNKLLSWIFIIRKITSNF